MLILRWTEEICSVIRHIYLLPGHIYGLIHGVYIYDFRTRVDADKTLARPTSQCHRTESIVFLERGIFSCAELQVFSYFRGWKEACQATRAISTTSRRELSWSLFFCKAVSIDGIEHIIDQQGYQPITLTINRFMPEIFRWMLPTMQSVWMPSQA